MNFTKAIELISKKLDIWIAEGIKMLPNLFVAILIVILGYFASKVIRTVAKKKFRKLFPTSTLADFAVSLLYVISFGIFAFLALKIMHLDKAITTALGTAGIAGVALAFAFQDIAANFISGIFMSFSKPFNVGDTIQINEFIGRVKEIRLRDTTILTSGGQFVTIPNKNAFQNAIINYTRYGKRKLEIKGGVSQADDLQKAKSVAMNALKDVKDILIDDTSFLYSGLGDYTINFTIGIWIDIENGGNYSDVLHEAIIKIKEAFDQNNITLPYPIRTIDFAMKGGKTLSDMVFHLKKNEND